LALIFGSIRVVHGERFSRFMISVIRARETPPSLVGVDHQPPRLAVEVVSEDQTAAHPFALRC
jgi:hypothetical protein